MRAPPMSLLIAAAGLAAAGCASSPPRHEAPVTSVDRACSDAATDPLHLTSNKVAAQRGDPEIEAILVQRGDPRLLWVNRQMYQSLHALDVELRSEQRIAACERSKSGAPTLEAQAGDVGNVTATGAAVASNENANGAAVSAMSATASRSTLIRKSSLSSAGGGGNGATMPKVVTGSDNDLVARRLRKAAEQETDPALRKKLWKEYADYRQGIAAK